MPLYKLTMVFTSATDPVIFSGGPVREAGYTESWYTSDNSIDEVRIKAKVASGLVKTRAGLLSNTSAIGELLIQQVGPVGGKQSFQDRFTGTAGKCDIPQMALQLFIPNVGLTVRRQVNLRGIPDGRIIGGVYNHDADYDRALTAYVKATTDWRWPAQDPTAAKVGIANINGNGVVTLNGANPFAAGAVVHVTRTKDALTNKTFRGDFVIDSTGPAANQLKLLNWTGAITTKGKMQLKSIVLMQPTATIPLNVVATTRKVGRPFDGYRGRVSKR